MRFRGVASYEDRKMHGKHQAEAAAAWGSLCILRSSYLATSFAEQMTLYEGHKMHADLQAEAFKICRARKTFRRHSPDALAELLSKAALVELKPGDVLFHAGDEGDSLFVLVSGELACTTPEDEESATLEFGAVFGELAALRLAQKRSETVKAKSEAKLWQVNADHFQASFSSPVIYTQIRKLAAAKQAAKGQNMSDLMRGRRCKPAQR